MKKSSARASAAANGAKSDSDGPPSNRAKSPSPSASKGAAGGGGASTPSGLKQYKGSTQQWTVQEDNQLRRLVDEHGHRKWSFIASKMSGRRGKQCRDRWLNHLKPDIRRGEWTQEEERILVEGHRMLGTRWAALAKLLPGRPENAIKNHWHATLRCKWAQRGGKISELQAYQHSLQLTNGGGGPGINTAAAAALGTGGAAAVAAAAAAAASKGTKPGEVPVTGAFDFDGAAAAAAVAAAAAAVVTGTTGAATGGTNSIARALDSIVASAQSAGGLGGLHSPSGSNTPLAAANLPGLMGTLAQTGALSGPNGGGATDAKRGDDEHALASMLGGLSQVLGNAATEADQEAILSMARSGIGTGAALTPAQAAAAAMQAAAVNAAQAQQQAQQQQAAKAVKAAAAASERAVTARYAAKSVAPRAPPPAENASGDIIEATTEPLDLARYLDAVRGGCDGEPDSAPELATLISTVDSKHGDKQPLGESLAQHGALVEGALLRISQAIRKRWNCRRMALVLRLGAATTGDVSLIVACSANRWRDAAGAAEHAAIEIKDKLIASIAPQCLSKQPMAAAALKAVAAAAGVGDAEEEKPPTNLNDDGDGDDEEDGVAMEDDGDDAAKEANEADDETPEGEGNDDGAAAAMDALAGPGRTSTKGGVHPASVVEVKSEDSEPKGLDTPDERAHA